MNVLGIDDELAEEYAPIPPGFTKGYPLPDGWKWRCYDDGSGSLDAPDGESFFAYDLCTGEMTDAEGRWTHVLTSGGLAGEKGDVRSSQRASLKDMETENRASADALSGYDAPSMNEGPSR